MTMLLRMLLLTAMFHSRLVAFTPRPSFGKPHIIRLSSTAAPSESSSSEQRVPLYRAEGLFAVHKPTNWTSNDVVSFIRRMLEREARERGAKPAKLGRRRNKNTIKVGHGGTLDPLATGVLVIGVGSGTKQLQEYLKGSKAYRAGGELGYETDTLDLEGNVTRREPCDHVTADQVSAVLPQFTGSIEQLPPIYSAIRVDGQRLYERARQGKTDDLEIPVRNVEVHRLELLENAPPRFAVEVECGGGTYIRSLIRDIGYQLDTVATTTFLERIKQGPYTLEDCLEREEWNPDAIYERLSQYEASIAAEDEQAGNA